jgi:16S rRNA (cytosine967-C5)-methyltransferase
VPLLQLDAQHSFLDLCAAPGGKTFQAIDARRSSRGVVAADRHLHRLRTLRVLAESGAASGFQSAEAGVSQVIDCVVLDAQFGLPFRGPFDRILVDAPCSGTGTLARNPEIKWRLRPEDLSELAAKQRAILSRALDHLAPAGVLVYSTCSLEPEENQEVVDAVRKERPSFEVGAYFQRVPGREPGDGFFACQMRRR